MSWSSSVYTLAAFALSEVAAKEANGPPSLSLDFSNVKTPQLIGILCGVVVFSATIISVFYLLFKSGSWSKFMAEMADPATAKAGAAKAERAAVVPTISVHPELYDNLLAASKALPDVVDLTELVGRDITVRPLCSEDLAELHAASSGRPLYDESEYDPLRLWGWVALDRVGTDGHRSRMDPPVSSVKSFKAYLSERGAMTHATIVHNVYKKPIGVLSLSNNVPMNLTIEIDNIWITPAFQGQKMSHEALLLVLRRLFELGYRRVTAETDSRHVICRKFLDRCGFSMEAVLRKHRIVHNRNRDTALYSMLNSDWEDIEVRIKKHIGLSLKPVMHNAIEIDSGKDIEKQMLAEKERLKQKEGSKNESSSSSKKKKKKK